jgi:hypothetical protein
LQAFAYFCALAFLSLLGCTRVSQGNTVTNSSQPMQMRTQCLGRLLIDLPQDFEQTGGSDLELTFGLDKNFRRTKLQLLRLAASQPEFNSLVAKRIADFSTVEHSRSPTKNMLAASTNINRDAVLMRAFDEPGMLDYFKAIVMVKRNDAIAEFTTNINKGDNPEVIESKLLEVVSRTTFVAKANTTALRGSCFGPLLLDAGQDGESFTVAFKTPRMPDVLISFDINSLVAVSDGGLFKRLDSKSGILGQSGIGPASYRKRKVMIGDRPAEEVFFMTKERGHVVRQLTAEVVMDKPATFALPMIAISLSMGGQVGPEDYRDASMSEADAMAMWDAILKSIRPRPGAL